MEGNVTKETRSVGTYTMDYEEVHDAVLRFLEDQGFLRKHGIEPKHVDVAVVGGLAAVGRVEVSWDVRKVED